MPHCVPFCSVGGERTASGPQAVGPSKQGPQESMSHLPMEITRGAAVLLHLQHLQGGHGKNRCSTDHPRVSIHHQIPYLPVQREPQSSTLPRRSNPSFQNCRELYKASPILPSPAFLLCVSSDNPDFCCSLAKQKITMSLWLSGFWLGISKRPEEEEKEEGHGEKGGGE